MNTIIIELCTEDRARLDRIAEALDTINKNNEPLVFAVDLAVEPATAETQTEETTEPEKVITEEPKAPTEPPQAKTSVADLQAKVVALVDKGLREKVKAIVNEYAPRVGDIPEDKRDEVMKRLTALEG